jgi:hypothetical protein
LRELHALRGEWRLEQGQWSLAAESLNEAVRMTRETGGTDAKAETQLALAKFHLKQLPKPGLLAEELSLAKKVSHPALAELHFAIGNQEQAKKHAFAAYEWAWNDGEPYVQRYVLNKATTLLKQLGAEIPKLPPYDPSKDRKLSWENEIAEAIEKLRSQKKPKSPKPSKRKRV